MHILIFITALLIPHYSWGAEQLGLDECRSMALKYSQNIQISREEVSAAVSHRKSAYTHFLPRLGFVGDYTRSDHLLKGKITTPSMKVPIVDGTTGGYSQYLFVLPPMDFVLGQENNYLLSFSVNQPLFTGGKITTQYEISKTLEQAAHGMERLRIADTVFDTDESYWRLASLQEKVKLAEMYRTMVARHVTDLENLLAEGIITKNDLLKARVAYNDAELTVFKANNGLKLSRMALCRFIGLPLETEVTAVESLEGPWEKVDENGLIEQAQNRRPEIDLLKRNVEIGESLVKLERSRYYPNVILNGGYTFINPDPYDNFKDTFGGDWRIGIVCQMDIFHFNERGHDLDASRHNKTANELKLDETKDLVALDVRQAAFKLNEASERVQLTMLSLTQSEENLRVSEENFKAGRIASTEVLDAQTLWRQAYTETIEAKAEYMVQKSALSKALGELDIIPENNR